MNTPRPGSEEHPLAPLADAPAAELRSLCTPEPLARDLWPAIAARLGPRTCPSDEHTAWTSAQAPAGATPARTAGPRRRRRNAGYAVAASVVLAAGVFWQAWPGAGLPEPASGIADIRVNGSGVATDAPLLHAADALAREYQGALREVQAATGDPAGRYGMDAELERNAAEVRAALARDPDALYLLQRLHRIYAHRLALHLRQA